jgi:hypothetical protein
MSTGWESRLAILRRDTEEKIIDPLRTHGWKASIDKEVENGEYLIVTAERGGHIHQVANMYSSATKNAVYKSLAAKVEHIYINGELYHLESYAFGIDTPVSTVGDFHSLLVEWNKNSTDGKFVADAPSFPFEVSPPTYQLLLSETPIDAIWLRLRQLASVTLARKLVETRAREAGKELDADALDAKAEGLAFALRNAIDYFRASDVQNISQRVLNRYYGSMSFALAEMLASPTGPTTLAEIEASTKQGHGLYTIDGEHEGLENIIVGLIATGVFPTWMKFLGLSVDNLPKKKAKIYSDLEKQVAGTWVTVEGLFARIPEVADLFIDIFDAKPAWVAPA